MCEVVTFAHIRICVVPHKILENVNSVPFNMSTLYGVKMHTHKFFVLFFFWCCCSDIEWMMTHYINMFCIWHSPFFIVGIVVVDLR